MTESKNLRFAIVGCGKIAGRHALHISRRGQLVAVCDIVGERAEALAMEYKAKAYLDLGSMLAEERLDVVAICTPNGLHAVHSISCLQAGVNVLCEKPMALTTEDCQSMMAAAAASGKLLAIVKQNRFNPPVIAVKELLTQGRLGRIVGAQVNCFWNRNKEYYTGSDWKGSAELDGGILFTQFSHFIDLLYWLLGEVSEVKAFTENHLHKDVIDLEDSGVAILKMTSGALVSLHYTVNSFEKNMEGSITLFGEKGTVKIGGEYLNLLEYQHISGVQLPSIPVSAQANDYGTYRGSMSNHDKVYDNLVAVLTGGANISTPAEDGLKTVEIINRITAAATAGRSGALVKTVL